MGPAGGCGWGSADNTNASAGWKDKCNALEKKNSDLERKLKSALADTDKANKAVTKQRAECDNDKAQLAKLRTDYDKLKADLAGCVQMREALEGQLAASGSPVPEVAENEIPPGCHDYDVDDEGTPQTVAHPGTFRLCGHGFLDYGFQLTGNPDMPTAKQQGHFLCRVEFELDSASSEIFLKFDYHMHGTEGGEGLCAYLLDPSVKGWDTNFQTSGPMGFANKAGALVGVALDLSGNFSGGSHRANHVTVRHAQAAIGDNLASSLYEPELLSTGDEEWRSVLVKFDIDDLNIDVEVDGNKVLSEVPLPAGFKPPRAACVAVCGAATNADYMICVNDVKLVSQRDE